MRQWLQSLFNESYLPQLERLKPTATGIKKAKALCSTMRDEWTEKGKRSLTQQKPLMDEVRSAIKQHFGADSWLLDYIRLERDEYFEINQQNAQIARSKQMQQQYISDPDAIVAKAVRLLESPEWADIACALAVLTGRRLNEVLRTAQFTVKSQWIVTFQGALKRRDEEVALVFDIPTLTTAQRVVEAIAHLREITPTDANEATVAIVSDRHFAQLVPAPPGKGKLYAHLWRSLYACIATFWYCPKHCDDLLYKAHILGHFQTLSADEMRDETKMQHRLETFASDRHYRLYEMDDAIVAHYGGKRKGIKLGHGGVVPLEAFTNAMPDEQPIAHERQLVASVRVWLDDRQRLQSIFEQLGLVEGNLQEKMSALIDWIEDRLGASVEPIESIESIEPHPESEEVELTEEGEASPTNDRPPMPTSLESKIDALVDTMSAFVQWQMQASSAAPHPQPQRVAAKVAPGENSHEEGQQRRSRGESNEIVNGAIDRLMQWNDAPGRLHDEKWAITINALKVASQSAQSAVLRVLDTRQDDIKAHHERHQIDPDKHNYRHRGKRSVVEIFEGAMP